MKRFFCGEKGFYIGKFLHRLSCKPLDLKIEKNSTMCAWLFPKWELKIYSHKCFILLPMQCLPTWIENIKLADTCHTSHILYDSR